MAGGTAQGEISAKEIGELADQIIRDREQELYRRAIVHWGSDLQRWMLIEELSELMIAVSKVQRFPCENRLNDLAEEIADARIIINQIEYLYNCAELVKVHRKAKLKRLAKMLGDP